VINCGFPGYLSNGVITGQSYHFGDILGYACRPGFQLVDGDRSQWCGRDGKWSGKKPTCKGDYTTDTANEVYRLDRVVALGKG